MNTVAMIKYLDLQCHVHVGGLPIRRFHLYISSRIIKIFRAINNNDVRNCVLVNFYLCL